MDPIPGLLNALYLGVERVSLRRPTMGKSHRRAGRMASGAAQCPNLCTATQAPGVSMPLQIRSYLLKRRQISVLGFGAPDCPGSP